MQEYNEEAFKDWNEKALVPWENCGRTFLPDRLEIHLRSWKGPKNSKIPVVKKDKASGINRKRPQTAKVKRTERQSSVPMMPPGLNWYICGRKYGTASLQIHLKSCKKQFIEEQKRLPKNMRRKLPQNSIDFDNLKCKGMNEAAMDQYNNEAFKQFNEEALVPWGKCGRTFLPDRLVVHLRSWKGPTSKTPMKNGNKSIILSPSKHFPNKIAPETPNIDRRSSAPRMPSGVTCYICGRKFGSKSLEIHLKSWKKKFTNEQKLLPKEMRRIFPDAPSNFEDIKIKGMTEASLDQYNDEAFKQFNEKS
jgi:hypothetical protein